MRSYFALRENWRVAAAEAAENSVPVLPDNEYRPVVIPDVWNKNEPGAEGNRLYRCDFSLDEISSEGCAFIEFAAVAGVCRAWLNGKYLGEHRGGYSLFRFDISSKFRQGENTLIVSADNLRYDDVLPLGGDFNNYGGIYRDVRLIFTDRLHFDLMHFGTLGVDVKPRTSGIVELEARIKGASEDEPARIEFLILDGDEIVCRSVNYISDSSKKLTVREPKLWNGKDSPHLYSACFRILRNDEIIDEVSLSFGFRDIAISPEQGFFLNGEVFRINGVSKHQDWEGAGSCPTEGQLDTDLELILESGANSVRLSHYQHPQYFYDLCDRAGLVVWAEIPLLSMPDGNDGVRKNASSQLKELILQCKHHPAICFWGLQNEIALAGESLEMYRGIEELQALAKELDDTRITAGANLYTVKNNSPLNRVTDMIGYNIYFGWYYGETPDFADFIDKFRKDNPDIPLGISEYGVDCNTVLHSASPKRKDYSEEFQALYHETVYPFIKVREYIWGSFVWNMFDFGSIRRKEGRLEGLNGKGLVTFDRKTKKDSFFYYKAQWSNEPFVHIASRRFKIRTEESVSIKVYSNLESVALSVDGSTWRKKSITGVFIFNDIPMRMGSNTISAVSGKVSDSIVIIRRESVEESYVYKDPNPEINVKNWFTLEEGENELFPEDRYSIMDSIIDLQSNPEVWQMLKQEIPRITDNERTQAMPAISLFRVFNYMSKYFSEEQVKSINNKLRNFKK